MTTESQIETHFLARFAETHGKPPEGFVVALWKRLGNVSVEQLEAASERIIRTKKAKSFPSFAECLEAIRTSGVAPSRPIGASGIAKDTYTAAALEHMKRHSAGGTMGMMIEPGTSEWVSWRRYFEDREIPHRRMNHIEAVARENTPEGVKWVVTDRYMVPARWPHEFDASANPPMLIAAE